MIVDTWNNHTKMMINDENIPNQVAKATGKSKAGLGGKAKTIEET